MHPPLIIFCLISTCPFLQYFITYDSEICLFFQVTLVTRKLTLLYVANDVIQNSKKKGPEYRAEFVKVLPWVFQGINKLVVCVSVARDNCAYCISANFCWIKTLPMFVLWKYSVKQIFLQYSKGCHWHLMAKLAKSFLLAKISVCRVYTETCLAILLYYRSKDDSLVKSTERIISVWEERHVLDATALSRYKMSWHILTKK